MWCTLAYLVGTLFGFYFGRYPINKTKLIGVIATCMRVFRPSPPPLPVNTVAFDGSVASLQATWNGQTKNLLLSTQQLNGRWDVEATLFKESTKGDPLPLIVRHIRETTTILGLPTSAEAIGGLRIVILLRPSPDDGSPSHTLSFNLDAPVILRIPITSGILPSMD